MLNKCFSNLREQSASGISDGVRHYVCVIENPRLWFIALPRFGPDWRVTRSCWGWKRLRVLVLIPRRKLQPHFLQLSLGGMDILVTAACACFLVPEFLSLIQEVEFGQTWLEHSSVQLLGRSRHNIQFWLTLVTRSSRPCSFVRRKYL